jgi:hypothetical protein
MTSRSMTCRLAGTLRLVARRDPARPASVTAMLPSTPASSSATAVVKAFRAAGLTFPWRHLKGPRKGEADWQPLLHSTVLRVLHNPRYAGAFTYGRHRERPPRAAAQVSPHPWPTRTGPAARARTARSPAAGKPARQTRVLIMPMP